LRPELLRIGGLVPFSTVDFPGRLCAVLFCQGCPWRCRYCHNPHLQPFTDGTWKWLSIENFLESRRGLLDAVVFSGGEPTAQPALEAAIQAVRRLGFQVGLHTAGIFPDRLRRVLPLVDWVGLDIKAPFDTRYSAITGVRASWIPPGAALDALLDEGVAYETRTTVHPALLGEADKAALQAELAARGAKPTRWQEFRPHGCADPELVGRKP
jgi:pyruvate formate lyase activating enzyme